MRGCVEGIQRYRSGFDAVMTEGTGCVLHVRRSIDEYDDSSAQASFRNVEGGRG